MASIWHAYPESLDRLRELVARGLSASIIACELGDEFGVKISRNAVIGKMHRKGVASHRLPSQNDEAVERARKRRQAVGHARAAKIKAARSARTSDQVAEDDGVEAPFVPTTPASDLEISKGQRRSTLSLTEDCCRWPVGDPGPNMFFCGAAKLPGSPYCRGHWMRARDPNQPNRRGNGQGTRSGEAAEGAQDKIHGAGRGKGPGRLAGTGSQW